MKNSYEPARVSFPEGGVSTQWQSPFLTNSYEATDTVEILCLKSVIQVNILA